MKRINSDEIGKIVHEVTLELASGFGQAPRGRLLAVIPGCIWGGESVLDYLRERKADVVSFAGPVADIGGCRTVPVRTDEEKARLVGALPDYDEVALVTPPISLLLAIARADDSSFEANLALRPLLWGKKVTLIADFDMPKRLHDTVFAGLADAVDVLVKAGVEVVSLMCGGAGEDEGLDLVTEQEVKAAHKSGNLRLKIKQGAIVTQLAQDTARDLGVIIDE